MQAHIRLDHTLLAVEGEHRVNAMLELAAPAAPDAGRPALGVALVLDRSGSMAGPKLEVARRCAAWVVERLAPSDRVAVVAYDDEVTLVAPLGPPDPARLGAAIAAIPPGGMTNLSGGWLKGLEELGRQAGVPVRKVVLLTDGLANVGITDPGELAGHAAELRARGVSTTTFGVGNDFDEALLQAMADAGGGHFYYIADAAQIRDHIASEVGETLEVVARDAEIEVLAGEGIAVETISPHRLTGHGTRSLVALGDLVADQVVDVVLRLMFPYGQLGRDTGIIVRAIDREGAFAAAGIRDARLTWTWADDRANDAQPRDADVDRAVARQFAARARQEAVACNRSGDFDGARRVLEGTAKRIRKYAGRDQAMRALIAELEAETGRFATPMPAALLKQVHFASANVARSRDMSGRAMRSR